MLHLNVFQRAAFYSGGDNRWYWNITGRNNRIRCHGEGHPSKSNALRAFKTLWKDLGNDGFLSNGKEVSRKPGELRRYRYEL